jgi:hypothetical protein
MGWYKNIFFVVFIVGLLQIAATSSSIIFFLETISKGAVIAAGVCNCFERGEFTINGKR